MKGKNFRSLFSVTMLFASVILVGGCAVESTAMSYDDIYADEEDIAMEEARLERQKPRKPYKDAIIEHQQKTYRENAESNGYLNDTAYYDTAYSDDFDMDNYYDYAYTARIHRFHSPAPIYNDYYDDYYTNLYWYTYDPIYWGTSIYLGYRWWWPSYSWGWNYGYRPCYYSWYGWHYGYYDYAWGWGYNPYWYGYRHGWRDAWYYNSHDRNSNFYRPDYGSGRLSINRSRHGSGTGYFGEPTASGTKGNVGTLSSNSRTLHSNGKMENGSNVLTFADKYNSKYGSNSFGRNISSTRPNGNLLNSSDRTSNKPATLGNSNNRRLDKPANLRNVNNNLSQGFQNLVTHKNNLNRTDPTNNPRSISRNSSNGNNPRSNISSPSRRIYTPPTVRQQRNSNIMRSGSSVNSRFSSSIRSNSSNNRPSNSLSNSSRSRTSSSRSISSRSTSRSSGSFSSGSRGGSLSGGRHR